MKQFSWKEFKPTILFLLKFIGFYIVGNLLYGIYITHFHPRPDPATHLVTAQTCLVLSWLDQPVSIADRTKVPTTALLYESTSILEVYEGCNGLNTMIIFAAFIIAFGPYRRAILWYIPLGIIVIHLMNLLRIALLFFVANSYADMMYFTHKYLFTAFLYIVIFVLWWIWVKRFSTRVQS